MCRARRGRRPCGEPASLLACACRSLARTVSSRVSLYSSIPPHGREFCLAGSARQPPEMTHVISPEGRKTSSCESAPGRRLTQLRARSERRAAGVCLGRCVGGRGEQRGERARDGRASRGVAGGSAELAAPGGAAAAGGRRRVGGQRALRHAAQGVRSNMQNKGTVRNSGARGAAGAGAAAQQSVQGPFAGVWACFNGRRSLTGQPDLGHAPRLEATAVHLYFF